MAQFPSIKVAFIAGVIVSLLIFCYSNSGKTSRNDTAQDKVYSPVQLLNSAGGSINRIENIWSGTKFLVTKDDEIKISNSEALEDADSTKLLHKLFDIRQIRICDDWHHNAVISSEMHCKFQGVARISSAFQIENCRAALRSIENRLMVDQKIRMLAAGPVFKFFRGSASLFAYNMMCNDPDWSGKKAMTPKVISNGDTHPENFGVMVMANGKLIWGVNDFDQSFFTPFTWDLKRGATGFYLGCYDRKWSHNDCVQIADRFLDAYLKTVTRPGCVIENEERFVEGSKASEATPFLLKLFNKSRKRETIENTKKWLLEKMSVKYDNETFFESEKIKPLPDSYIPMFQDAVDAYLFNGVSALALYPNDGRFFKVVSVARKLGSGTGSIGLNRYFVLIHGRSESYGNIVLEFKEASSSVLEAFFDYKFTSSEEGKRAVNGEHGAYPYANLFYGWTTYPLESQNSYVVTERSKHSVAADLDTLNKTEYELYATRAGTALSFYHLRARCARYQCPLNERAMVDIETCTNIQDYLKNYKGSIHENILSFSIGEAATQILDHQALRNWVSNNAQSLKLLTSSAKES